jgi:hypothetical protein
MTHHSLSIHPVQIAHFPILDQLYSCKRLYTLHIVPCLSLHLMKRDRVSGDKLFKGAMNQIKIMRNADAKSVSTTSSRRSLLSFLSDC